MVDDSEVVADEVLSEVKEAEDEWEDGDEDWNEATGIGRVIARPIVVSVLV